MAPPAHHGLDWRRHTPLCERLGIRYPIIQAGMAGGITTPELVAAVSNAGGLGSLAGGRLAPDELRHAIRAVKQLTTRPFSVNLILAPPETNHQSIAAVQKRLDRLRAELRLPDGTFDCSVPGSRLSEQLDVIFADGVSALSVALGDPAPIVSRAHQAGIPVVAMVTTVEEAKQVADAGADMVVAQGADAGGHRSTFRLGPNGDVPLVGTMALIPQVVDAVSIPVIAAGGVADGRGLVAALALGAAGVQIGTRFLVARESGAFPGYIERLFKAKETDTVVTRAYTGRPARGVRNRLVEHLERQQLEPLAFPLQGLAAEDIYRAAQQRNDADYYPLLAGQALRLLKRHQGAAEIIEDIMKEATACLARFRQRGR